MKAKKYRRCEHFMKNIYEKAFAFHAPYQIIVDSSMLRGSAQHLFDLSQRFSLVLGSTVKLFVTSCTMKEIKGKLDSVEGFSKETYSIARDIELRRCRSTRCPNKEESCILEIVEKNNPHKFLVATNSHVLKEKLRLIPGVPIIYLEKVFPLLEAPSSLTMKLFEKKEREKITLDSKEKKIIQSIVGETLPFPIENIHKRRKAKGPNPLSIKKRQVNTNFNVKDSAKRKRKKKQGKVS